MQHLVHDTVRLFLHLISAVTWYTAIHFTYKKIQSFTRTKRARTIWNHYQLRAKGAGHRAAHVFDCLQDNCGTLENV